MKKARMFLAVMAAALTLQVQAPGLADSVQMVQTVQAAQTDTTVAQTNGSTSAQKKNGLIKEGKRYCYYQNGRKVKQQWKTIKGKKYYFDKNGNSCSGPYKIKNVVYMFASNGQLSTGSKNRIVKGAKYSYYVDTKGVVHTGWFRRGKYLYLSDSMGRLYCNRTYQGIKLNSSGRTNYTEQLGFRMKVHNLVGSITNSKMTKAQKLRACYNYVGRNGGYRYSTAYYPNLSNSRWYVETADRMITQKKGNCYGFACAFAAMAKDLGYNPTMICGLVPGSRDGRADGMTRHCWVKIDGKHYDPEGYFAGWGGCFGSTYYPMNHVIQQTFQYKY